MKNQKLPPKKKQVSRDNSTKHISTQKTIAYTNYFEKYIAPYSTLFFILVLVLIGFLAFGKFLSVNQLFFFKGIGSDSLNQDYPGIMHTIALLEETYLYKYSFYTGMGDAYINSYPIEPVGWLREIITRIGISFGAENYLIYSRFPIIFIFYYLFSGLLFYGYFQTIDFSKYVSIIGALALTYSGYMVVGSSWDFYGHIFRASLLLFSFEQFFVKKRWYFLPIAFIYLSGNPFILYLYSFFLAIYASLRYFSNDNTGILGYIKLSGGLILLGSIGVFMNFVDFSNSFQKMYNSPRVSGNASYSNALSSGLEILDQAGLTATMILRFFSSDILGTGSNFKGWFNYFEAPLFYVGLFSLIIFPQVFIHLNKRNKIIFGAYLSFWALTLIFPYLRRAILAFTGDYFRFGFDFFIPFSILFMAAFALNEILKTNKINKVLLLITLSILLLALYYPYTSFPQWIIIKEIRFWVTFLLFAYSGLLWLFTIPKTKYFIQLVFLMLIISELSAFGFLSFQNRKSVSKAEYKITKGGYGDGSVKAINYLKSIDSIIFYRIEKDYYSGNAMHGSLNDGMAQKYYGTSSYSSFNQINYVRFLEETGIIEKGNESQTRWINGLRNSPLLLTFANVKYYLSKSSESAIKNFGFKHLSSVDSIHIYQNEYTLPFGYTYKKRISLDEFSKLSSFHKQTMLLNACVTENEEFQRFSTYQAKDTAELISNNSFTFSLYKSFTDSLSKNHLNISSFKQYQIKGDIELDTTKILFFTIPFDEGWKLKLNDKPVELFRVNLGFTGALVEKGKYDVNLAFEPDNLSIFNLISFITIGLFWIGIIIDILYKRVKKRDAQKQLV